VVCWQVKLCDPHLSALEVRFSRRGAIQIDHLYQWGRTSLCISRTTFFCLHTVQCFICDTYYFCLCLFPSPLDIILFIYALLFCISCVDGVTPVVVISISDGSWLCLAISGFLSITGLFIFIILLLLLKEYF